jgi:hypothetical protein
MRVDGTVIHNTYVDRTIVVNNTIVNNNHVSYNGGPGGIQHTATPAEQVAERDQHTAPTSFQTQQQQTAKADKSSYAKANGGHPQTVVAARPPGEETHVAATVPKPEATPAARPEENIAPKAEPESHAAPAQHATPQERAAPPEHGALPESTAPQERATPQERAAPPEHAAPPDHAKSKEVAAPKSM